MNGKRLAIGGDLPSAELRRLARREPDRAAAAQMQAIAGALEGMTRAEAARLAGMEWQALRDVVVRYVEPRGLPDNAEGLAGLHDRPRPGSKPRLDEGRCAALRQLILDGPDVETTGLSAWTLRELCREVEAHWGVRYHEDHTSKLVRALGLSRQKGRPSHPKVDPAARETFSERGHENSSAGARNEPTDRSEVFVWQFSEDPRIDIPDEVLRIRV